MKEVNIGGLKSIADARSTDKSAKKPPSGKPGQFLETLETAQAQIGEAGKSGASGITGKTEAVTADTIKAEASRLNEEYQQMMLAKQNISKLYQIVQSNKQSDKS